MKNFYLIYSSDKSIINKELEVIKNKLNIDENNIIYYDIEAVYDIINESSTISMFSPYKLIIIDINNYFKDKKNIDNISLLEDYFTNYNSNSYLIFIYNNDTIDNRKKLVNLIKKYGEVKKLETTDNYFINYTSNYIKNNNYNIEPQDIPYFISKVGNNINNITNELDKIMLYKINDKIITRKDIDLLTIENNDENVYDLVNAILKKENKKAITLYYNFINNGMDTNQILLIIASQIRLLFQVKRLSNLGKTNEEIAKILELKSIYRVKYLLSDSYYYTEQELLNYLYKLAQIDKAIKTSNKEGNILLELFIINK